MASLFNAVLEKREEKNHKWVILTKTIVKPSRTLYCLQIIAFITESCNWISSREFIQCTHHTILLSEREFRQQRVISLNKVLKKNSYAMRAQVCGNMERHAQFKCCMLAWYRKNWSERNSWICLFVCFYENRKLKNFCAMQVLHRLRSWFFCTYGIISLCCWKYFYALSIIEYNDATICSLLCVFCAKLLRCRQMQSPETTTTTTTTQQESRNSNATRTKIMHANFHLRLKILIKNAFRTMVVTTESKRERS